MSLLFLRLLFPVLMTLFGVYLLVLYFQNPEPAQNDLVKALLATGLGLAWTIFRYIRWKRGAY